MNKVIFFTIVWLLCITDVTQAEKRDPWSKDIFTKGFPWGGFCFRGENSKTGADGTYSEWEEFLTTNHVGVIRKFVREELSMESRMDESKLRDWLHRYAKAHSEELLLLHFNGRAQRPEFKQGELAPFHWILKEGISIDGKVTPEMTEFDLPRNHHFKQDRNTLAHNPGTSKPSVALLVERHDGQFNWEKFEYVKFNNVSRKGGALTVERGCYGTKPLTLKNGHGYLAQIPSYSGRLCFNLAPSCPRDKNGDTAADILLKRFEDWFGRGGQLEPMDGIAFDVFNFTTNTSADTDLDGLADGGVIEGKNEWAQGAYEFMYRLRQMMGDNFIITSDGHHPDSQRCVGVLNGMESEGLVQHNDGWRGIARTVNIHRYWNDFNPLENKFSFIAFKTRIEEDNTISSQLARFAHGMAVCLGVGITKKIPESHKGEDNEACWLGHPKGRMIHLARRTPDLLEGKGIELSSDFLKHVSAGNMTRYRITKDSKGIYIYGDDKKSGGNLSITISDLEIPPGDVVINFAMMSAEGRKGFEDTPMPRLVSMEIDGRKVELDKQHDKIWGFTGRNGYSPLVFYYRKAGGDEGTKLNLTITIEGSAPVVLRQLTMYAAPAVFAREFDNGVVLVNPAMNEVSFNLKELFGTGKKYRRIKVIKEGGGLCDYNNGARVDDLTDVRVPDRNALFLLKE